MKLLTCWTCSSVETQPVLRRRQADPGAALRGHPARDTIDARIVVGTWTSVEQQPTLTFQHQRFDNGSWSPRMEAPAVALTAAGIEQRTDPPPTDSSWLEGHRHLVDLSAALNACPQNRYFEITLTGLAVGALLRFKATAALNGTGLTDEATAALWMVAPQFSGQDLRCSRTTRAAVPGASGEPTLPDDQWWVLCTSATDGFDHLRLDMLDTTDWQDHGTPSALTPVTIALNDRAEIDIRCPRSLDWNDDTPPPEDYCWPVVDRSTDSILLSSKRRPGDRLRKVQITTGRGRQDQADTCTVDVGATPNSGPDHRPTALILIHYCIQGFNDLFARPLDVYDPPRNYIQVTFQDEDAAYCSRPEAAENGVPDGYRYALDAQDAYRVPTHWAFNGGVLTLLKQGLDREDFARLTTQVASGLISPANAGFAAHRPPYYRAETNRREVDLGDELLDTILGRSRSDGRPGGKSRIYYPDQRIYEAKPGEVDAYRGLHRAGVVDYLVLDRSTVANMRPGGGQQDLFGTGRPEETEGNYLWEETGTGLRLLLIEDTFRNRLMAGSKDDLAGGKIHYDLRRLFMEAVSFPRDQPRKLFVYGDDVDHACGNGWFDGGNGGSPIFDTKAYLASLCWIANHPWVRAWTVDDPEFDPADHLQAQALTLSSAICPTVDPGGAETLDHFGNAIHFDTWEQEWARTTAAWYGVPFGALSNVLEETLISWPSRYRNDLYELAWMYFLSSTHESMWSKEPLVVVGDPNTDPVQWPPEDFVVAESIQQCNTWVYLNASIWARWAQDQARVQLVDDATHVIAAQDGRERTPPDRLLELIRRQGSADAWWIPASSSGQGCYWDHDCMSTIVLYNRQALVVIDRNGGRITQIFSRTADGRVISLSGTFKAYQFLAGAPTGIAVVGDGERLQNTVFTPNHAYVATDVTQSLPRLGTAQDPRRTDPDPAWYPDTFNEYEAAITVDAGTPVVELTYGPAAGTQPATSPLDPREYLGVAVADGIARRAGALNTVWHTGTYFTKKIRLTGHTIDVTYAGVEPGHTVANEFAVDLAAAVREGGPQIKTVGRNGRSIRLSRAPASATARSASASVTVRLQQHTCEFLQAASQRVMPVSLPSTRPQWISGLWRANPKHVMPASAASATGHLSGLQQDFGELNRVLTNDLRIICPNGGNFGYQIDLRN